MARAQRESLGEWFRSRQASESDPLLFLTYAVFYVVGMVCGVLLDDLVRLLR